jgi:hypothetical protein
MSNVKVFKKEIEEQKEWTIQAMRSLLFSLDQNGHLFVRRDEKNVLVSAIELLGMK